MTKLTDLEDVLERGDHQSISLMLKLIDDELYEQKKK